MLQEYCLDSHQGNPAEGLTNSSWKGREGFAGVVTAELDLNA